MPNHCENRMSFYCATPELVTAALADIGDEVGGEFKIDFHKLIPMPEILKKTASGFRTFNVDGVDTRVSVWISEEGQEDRLPTPEERAEIDATGYNNWLDWACAKWGTKWNAYDQNNFVDEDGASLTFNTAWGPPQPWLEALKAKHPSIDFHGIYVIEFNEGAGSLFP